MIISFALAHTLSTAPVQISFLATEPVTIARSYGSRSSSFRSSSYRRSSYSAPPRIRVNSTSVQRVSPPRTINISKPANSSLTPKLGPTLQKTTLKRLANKNGMVPITKSAPPKPILVSEPKTTPPKTIISAPRPKNTIAAPSASRYYQQSSNSPVIIHQDSSFSNPWMWMYLMDNRNQAPQAPQIQTNAAPRNLNDDTVSTKIVTREERNPLKYFLLISLGLGCGIPVGYLFLNKK
jgi:hypothetical protein